MIEEAKNQLLRSQLQTPLLETPGGIVSTEVGTGFVGATPLRQSSVAMSEIGQRGSELARPTSVLTTLTEQTDKSDLVDRRTKKERFAISQRLKSFFEKLPEAKDEYELVTRLDVDENDESVARHLDE